MMIKNIQIKWAEMSEVDEQIWTERTATVLMQAENLYVWSDGKRPSPPTFFQPAALSYPSAALYKS